MRKQVRRLSTKIQTQNESCCSRLEYN